MYEVTNEFIEAMHANTTTPVLRGTVGGAPFTGSDVILDSFRITNQNVDVAEIKLGGVFVGELTMTMRRGFAETRGDWTGKVITAEWGLNIGGTVQMIPVPGGQYTISQAQWTDDGLELTAYDNMGKLDKAYSNEQSAGKPWEWLNYIGRMCSAEIGNTVDEIQAMPNGQEIISLYSMDMVKTYRDLLSFLAATLGGYATIDRRGAVVIRRFSGGAVDEWDQHRRFAGSSFSDYRARYTGLSVVNMKDDTLAYYHTRPDDGLTMKMGSNPFLQYGTDSKVKEMRENILRSLSAFDFVPFSTVVLGTCVYDLGDVIQFTGGIAADSKCCIMSYEFSLGEFMMGGYGDNPALQSAQTKLEKNISGLQRSQSSDSLKISSITNISQIPIGENWTKLGRVSFGSTKDQTVLFHGVNKLNIDQAGTIRYKYAINGQENEFIHEVQAPAGVDTVTLFLPFNIEGNIPYNFDIYIQSDGAAGTVEPLDLKGAIVGAGIVTNEWDGFIVLEDSMGRITAYPALPRAMSEEVSISMHVPTTISAEDILDRIIVHGIEVKPLTERVRITMKIGEYKRLLEDGTERITEDGILRYTKGGYIDG